MKIGLITTYFNPFRGGAEETVFHLANQLSKNHEVHIFTSDRKNDVILDKKEEIIGNIHIHRCRTFFRYRYYAVFYPSLLYKILKHDLDIIHTNSLGFLWHDFCLWFKKLKSPNTKFVITPHGPFMALKYYSGLQNFIKSVMQYFDKKFIGLYDAVIQVNPSQSSWLVDYGFDSSKIVFIPNGIDVSILKDVRYNDFLKKYNLNNKFILSYVGRIHKYKGLDNVVKVMPDLLKINNDIVFVIFGQDGDFIDQLNVLVRNLKLQDSIRIIIGKDDSEKFKLLQASEIYIFPSEWEAFGITVLEAMAKKNVIISTKTEGGLFLVGKENGLLYEFGDLVALKNNIIKLISDKKLRNKMQDINYKKAREFTWQKISKQVENLYRGLK